MILARGCNYDSVSVISIGSPNRTVAKYCGSNLPTGVSLQGPALVSFVSDRSVVYKGFKARFEVSHAEDDNKEKLFAAIFKQIVFLKKWANLGPFFVYFLVFFKQTIQFLQQINVKKMSIQCQAPEFELTPF